jgi:hypothetical protein
VSKISNYSKALVAAAAALASLSAALMDGAITPSEWVAVASAVVGALLVYAVPNTDS